MKKKSITTEIIEIKNRIHRIIIENVNTITKKEFDSLREAEIKLNQFLKED